MVKVSKLNRFARQTDILDLKRLEHESRKFLYIGFVLAVCFHATLFISYPHRRIPVLETQFIPVDLIVRRPRLTKPLMIEKKSVSGKYAYRKKFAPGKPSRDITTKFPLKQIEMYHDFSMELDYDTVIQSDILSDSLQIEENIALLPKDIIPLKNQTFHDNGKYKSTIIIPPENKMAIQGYTHIAIGCFEHFTPSDILTRAVYNLTDALNFYTNIYATCDQNIHFSFSSKIDESDHIDRYELTLYEQQKLQNYYRKPERIIFKYPLIYISADKSFELTKNEMQNLINYLSSGGFVIIDNSVPEHRNGNIGKALKKMMQDALKAFNMTAYIDYTPLGPVTRYRPADYIHDKMFKPIPNNHDLFHCFFDFENGPPGGYWADSTSKNILEGIYLDERLVGLYVNGYGLSWDDRRNEDQIKMGVNMVVYALKQGKGRYNDKTGKFNSFASGPVRMW